APCDLWTFRFAVDGQAVSGEQHVRFTSQLLPTTAETLVTAVHSEGVAPVLTRRAVGAGQVVVISASTFRYPAGSGRVTSAEPVSLTGLPQLVVDRLRSCLLADAPQVNVRSKVGVYRFGDRLALTNFNDQGATARVTGVAGGPRILYPTGSGDVVPGADGTATVNIPQRGFMVLTVGE
ncbi:hypothetical protein HN371_10375, partial [Candidatus Poribacteria bacterium]|nr:hypothetical protein [Candidatus Poribacteria bacterium]